MTEELDRTEFMTICQRLMVEDDAEALAAARDIKAKLEATGLTWDDVLAPEDAPVEDDPEDDELDEDDEPDDDGADDSDADAALDDDDGEDESEEVAEAEEEAEEDPAEISAANAEALATIDRLLGRSDISETLREDLVDYKDDIKEGEFDAADRKYIKALAARMRGGK